MTTATPLEHLPAQPMPPGLEASVSFPSSQIVKCHAQVGDTTVNYTASVGGPDIVLLVPGLMGCERFSEPLRNQLGLMGYTAISYESARSRRTIRGAIRDIGETTRDMLHPSSLHLDTLTAVIDDIGCNTAFLDTQFGSILDLTTVRLDPHSYGARAASEYALRHPVEVSSTVMLAPHGLEKLLGLHLLRRSGEILTAEFIPFFITHRSALPAGIVCALLGHTVANPIRLACESLSSAVDASNLDRLPLLSSTGKVAIMGFANDKIIDSGSLAHAAELHDIPFEFHPDKDAGHLAPYTHAQSVAALTSEMHRRLESS